MARRRTLVLAGCLLIAAETDVVIYNLHAAVAGYPVERFVADFDRNIQNVPIAAEIIAHDAAFRKRVIRATAKAYEAGGWNAADDALDAIMIEKQPEVTWTLIHADDHLVVTLWERYLDTMRRLSDKPAACAYYLSGEQAGGVSFPSAGKEYHRVHPASLAAYKSGAANLKAGTAPDLPSEDVVNALLEKSTALGKPYSEAEMIAWTRERAGLAPGLSDAAICARAIKIYGNILALPEADAAALICYVWGTPLAARFAKSHG